MKHLCVVIKAKEKKLIFKVPDSAYVYYTQLMEGNNLIKMLRDDLITIVEDDEFKAIIEVVE